MQNIKSTTLHNGIRIITEEITYLQSFSLGFWFSVGSRDEKADYHGISHFTEHMLFKGTSKRTAKQISDTIESCGGYLNAFTSKELTCYFGRGLAKNFSKTFDVISDMIQNSLFKSSEIKKEASVIIDELYDIEDNPEELIFEKFEETVYNGTSLGKPIIGNEETIRSFNHEMLSEFTRKNYRSDNLMIVVCGAIKHEEVCELTAKYFNLKNGNPQRREMISLINPLNNLIIEKDIQQVHSIIGCDSYGYKDDERIPLTILSSLLGDGSSSRLFQAVREKKGITYQIQTFINSFYETSVFGVYFSTNEKQTKRVHELILKEMNKIKTNGIGSKELKRVKEYIKGSIILGLENTTNRMIRIANSMFYFNRVITVDEIIKRIDSVTPEQIIAIANQLFNENKLITVTIKSNKDISKAA